MDLKTAQALNKLNNDFYLVTEEYFNRTRQFYWQGWEKLIPFLPKEPSLRVLDVGGGNGRFGKWVKEKRLIEYVNIDSNAYLLKQAQKEIPEGKMVKTDILAKWPVAGKFDLVAILGVMHHVALPADRVKLLKKAKEALAKNGVLLVSFWEFNKLKQFDQLKSDWSVVNIDKWQLDKHDFLLGWNKGVQAYRYCHLYDDEEIKSLIETTGMTVLADYRADGSNRYLLLQKPQTGKGG